MPSTRVEFAEVCSCATVGAPARSPEGGIIELIADLDRAARGPRPAPLAIDVFARPVSEQRSRALARRRA